MLAEVGSAQRQLLSLRVHPKIVEEATKHCHENDNSQLALISSQSHRDFLVRALRDLNSNLTKW